MAIVWAALLMSGIVCTSSQYIYSEEDNRCASNGETMVQIRGLLIQQMRIQESVDSLRQMVKRLEEDVTKTKGDVQIVKRESLLPGPCSTSDSCPDGAVCKEGVCSCNETYLNYKDVCHKVTNLALEKTVSASSTFFSENNRRWENAVDGLTRVNNIRLLFHTGYELFPWLSINLGTELCIVKSIILFNRIDNHGRWLHDVETRVGKTSNWSQMSACGTFIGPSKTGETHVIECKTPLYGKYVTVKIVKPNYITDDPVARGGKNALVLEEAAVNGIVL